MPTPKRGEKKEQFIARCMAYPDLRGKPAKQRVGECYGIWHEHHKGENHAKGKADKACDCPGCRREKAVRASLYQVRSHKAQNLEVYDVPALGVQCSDAELSATGVLTTNDPDLVGDEVIPAGVGLLHHRLNPTVLLEHNLIDGKWQIGKCESPGGEYTVVLDGDRLLQKSFFSQSLPEAKQTYLLIKEGILRGNSMGFKEDKVVPRAGGGRIIQACRLYEVTWTCLPMNPFALDTLTSIFSRGRLDGEPLTLTIKSMLQPWAAPRKYYPTEIKETHMFEHKSPDDYEEKSQGVHDQPEDDMEVEQKSADMEATSDAPAEEKSLAAKAQDQEGQQGEKILKALVDHLAQLRDEVEEAKATTENERVQDCLDDWDAKADEMVEDLKEVLDDEYGQDEGDSDGEEEGGEGEEKSRKSRKARKAQKSRKSLRRKSQAEEDDLSAEEEALQRSIERKLKLLEKLQQS